MSKLALRWLLLVLLMAVPSMGWAATYYVSTTGSDSASCELATSTGSPKQHIMGAQGGLACMSAGDTLYLRGGTYSEEINSNVQTIPSGTSWTNAITIASYPGETATFTYPSPGGNLFNLRHSYIQYIIIDRLRVNCNSTGADVGSLSIGGGAHHIRMQNTEVFNCVGAVGAFDFAGSDIQVLNNKFHHNGFDSFLHQAVYIGYPNTIIDGNEIYDNLAFGIQLYTCLCAGMTTNNSIIRNNRIHGNGQIAITVHHGDNIQIYNNVAWNNPGGIQMGSGNSNVKVYNNTFHLTTSNYILEVGGGSAGTDIQNNIFSQYDLAPQNNGSGTTFGPNLCTGTGTGCSLTNSNPLFVSPTGSPPNFRVQAGSPAINAGANLSGTLTTDADGDARPGSGPWTIGADEFEGGAPPVAGPVGTVQAVWHLNAGQGTVAGDSVGEHHGAFSPNGGWAAGLLGPAAGNFDGTRSITVSNVSGLRSTASKTLSAWVKMSTTDTNACEVVSDGDSSVLRVTPEGELTGFFYDGSGWNFVTGGTGLLDNAWHHVLWTYDQTAQSLYADGAEVATDPQTAAISYTQGPTLKIGQHGNGDPDHDCIGAIDEVTVLDGWCSPACVANLYANKDRRARRTVGSAP
jgi:hypothetical protein